MKCCCNSNSTQYERNRWFGHLAFALAWAGNGAKLPSVGLWLNASKSESVLERNDIFSGNFWRTPVEVPRYLLRHNSAGPAKGRWARSLPVNRTRNIAKAKSFADDLNKERGIVRGRVAVLLRSSEIKPLFSDFIFYLKTTSRWQKRLRKNFQSENRAAQELLKLAQKVPDRLNNRASRALGRLQTHRR